MTRKSMFRNHVSTSSALSRVEYDFRPHDQHWRVNYLTRPYVKNGDSYENYQLAYMYGAKQRYLNPDKEFEEIAPSLQDFWISHRDESDLEWERAQFAVRDAFNRN